MGLESTCSQAHLGDCHIWGMSGLTTDLLCQSLHFHKIPRASTYQESPSSSAPGASAEEIHLIYPSGSSFPGLGALLQPSQSKAKIQKSFKNAQISVNCNKEQDPEQSTLWIKVALRRGGHLSSWFCSGLWLLWPTRYGERDAMVSPPQDQQLLPWIPGALSDHTRNQTTQMESHREGSARTWRSKTLWDQSPVVPTRAQDALKPSWTFSSPATCWISFSVTSVHTTRSQTASWALMEFPSHKIVRYKKMVIKVTRFWVVCYAIRDNWKNFREKAIIWSNLRPTFVRNMIKEETSD